MNGKQPVGFRPSQLFPQVEPQVQYPGLRQPFGPSAGPDLYHSYYPTKPVKPTISNQYWPYLVGISESCAAQVISNQRPDIRSISFMKPRQGWTNDLNFNRVRINADKNGIVISQSCTG